MQNICNLIGQEDDSIGPIVRSVSIFVVFGKKATFDFRCGKKNKFINKNKLINIY